MQEVISDQEKEYRQNSEAINMRMHGVFLHTHRVGTVHSACLALSNFRRADNAEVVLRIEKRVQQGLPSLMAENGNACTTYAYLGPTPGFSALFYHGQCLCSALSTIQMRMMVA